MSRVIETEEGPEVITPENVMYFSHHTGEFTQTLPSKAKKFLKHKCLMYLGDGVFVCNNLPGYNVRQYTIQRKKKVWTCNCQGWVKKCKDGKLSGDGVNCSHLLALMYAFKIKYFQKL